MKSEIMVYYFPQKHGREISSGDLLSFALSAYFSDECPGSAMQGEAKRSFEICRADTHSKPYVKGMPGIRFSVSHSGEWWACAISDREVGLDLQAERVRDPGKLAARFFHPDEVKWLEENGLEYFGLVWACKESYLKYTGRGLKDGMDYFSVVADLSENENISEKRKKGGGSVRAIGSLIGAVRDEHALKALARQAEVPFRDGYRMVLTSGEMPEYKLIRLNYPFENSGSGLEGEFINIFKNKNPADH